MQAYTQTSKSDPQQTLHVLQGDCKVSGNSNTMMTTILGSCIAVCMFDETAHCGGMNHFLLPDGDQNEGGRQRYGAYSMEVLINELLKIGARRDRLRAKVFGGGRMVAGFQDIGARNASFTMEFLNLERIPCLGHSTGGNRARRIRFYPATGLARQQLLASASVESVTPKRPLNKVESSDSGDLELL